MTLMPVMRAKLPEVPALLDYLRRIDASRIYTNYGPLSAELESRLAVHFAMAPGGVTTVANATLGLALALSAQEVRPGSLCLIPAWTYVATAQAAVMSGLTPYFVDVDEETWALDPNVLDQQLAAAPGEVGAIMPVVPFGRPIDFAAWDAFNARSGIPVVIDAAAGFDVVAPARVPVVASLHATKAFGVGEGGLIISSDPSLIEGVRMRSNHGFRTRREALVPATNAKFSEYHAAVGLAALDEWPQARGEWLDAAAAYRRSLAASPEVSLQPGLGDSWVSSTCVVRMSNLDAGVAEKRLLDGGIESRRWWANGAHLHPSMLAFPRAAVPVTEALARSALGLPLYRDITPGEIERVAECLLGADA